MVLYVQPEMSKYSKRVIYKFISPVGCVYIGKAVNARRRIRKHKNNAYIKKDGDWKIKSRWKKAIREFGWENLVVEILECVPEGVSLDERERYWIAQYNACDPEYGYNTSKGGGGFPKGVYKHTEESKAKISAKQFKPVTSCEIKADYGETQLVEFVSYASASEAARETGVANSNISYCCNKQRERKSAGNRFWHFTKEDDLVGEHIVPRIADMPRQYKKKRKRQKKN